MHLTLKPDKKRLAADLKRQTDAFIDLGFEYQGTFRVVEMPGVRVIGLLHPRKNVTAIMYEHPHARSWMECIAMLDKDEVAQAFQGHGRHGRLSGLTIRNSEVL
jgi:hypothetical protein